jgi:probable DNA metabolism protein
MALYIYDGSFPGLLTTLHAIRAAGEEPDDISAGAAAQLDLFSRPVEVPTDEAAARSFIQELKTGISQEAFCHILYAFLSEEGGMEKSIWSYVKKGFVHGREIDLHLYDPDVKAVHDMGYRVRLERHRMTGFLRFRMLTGDLLHAEIEPDHNILTLLAPHFLKRFSTRRWSIHDVKRGTALLYDGTSCTVVNVVSREKPLLHSQEKHYQELWRIFYRQIAIAGRKNPVQQRRMMPVRYWKYLPELQGICTV